MIRHYIHRRPVGPGVHISITYSGICHSDIHTARDEWGSKQYPLCVGHEIMGVVKAVGGDVTVKLELCRRRLFYGFLPQL